MPRDLTSLNADLPVWAAPYEPLAPLGYPALHHLTSPLRKAATAAHDTDLIHLWAGTGYRQARVEPAAQTLTRLAAER